MSQSAMAQAGRPQSAMPRCRNLQCWPKSIAEDRPNPDPKQDCASQRAVKKHTGLKGVHLNKPTRHEAAACRRKKITGGLKEPTSQSTGADAVHVQVRDVPAWNSPNSALDGL
jgi:hypothetical protein